MPSRQRSPGSPGVEQCWGPGVVAVKAHTTPWGSWGTSQSQNLQELRLGSGVSQELNKVGLCSGLDIIRSRGDSMLGYLIFIEKAKRSETRLKLNLVKKYQSLI